MVAVAATRPAADDPWATPAPQGGGQAGGFGGGQPAQSGGGFGGQQGGGGYGGGSSQGGQGGGQPANDPWGAPGVAAPKSPPSDTQHQPVPEHPSTIPGQ